MLVRINLMGGIRMSYLGVHNSAIMIGLKAEIFIRFVAMSAAVCNISHVIGKV
jgi:hypothetical protein